MIWLRLLVAKKKEILYVYEQPVFDQVARIKEMASHDTSDAARMALKGGFRLGPFEDQM